jgi:hypothetical protein
MAQVNRYDEGGGGFNFTGGLNFWNTRFRDVAGLPGNPNDIETACGDIINSGNALTGIPLANDNKMSYGFFDDESKSGAFLLNGASPANGLCWALAHRLLNQGMQARSCAEYFCRHGDTKYWNSRFGVKFVPCPDRAW